MIMYKYVSNHIPKKILENCPNGWGIGNSENGWMTSETFYEYIANVFHPWLLKQDIVFPIVLYLDGHSSHVTMPLVSFCRDKQIEVIALYPNATHVIQPLDTSLFHPFKEIWRKIVPKWKIDNDSLRLKKEDFPTVLNLALEAFVEERKIIQSGFKACGLMPFNPDIVNFNVLKKKSKNIENSKEPEVNQAHQNSEIENMRRHLLDIEKYIPPELLQEFRLADTAGEQVSNIEQKGLYEYWLRIKQATLGT